MNEWINGAEWLECVSDEFYNKVSIIINNNNDYDDVNVKLYKGGVLRCLVVSL